MTLEVGSSIGVGEEVPIGTLVKKGSTVAVRTYSGWLDNNGSFWMGDGLDGAEIISLAPKQHETINQYKQRFRTVAIGGAYRHSIRVDDVERVLTKLEVPQFEVCPGMVVASYDRSLVIPDGSLLRVGSDAAWSHMGLYVRKDHAFNHVMGWGGEWYDGVLIEVPGVTEPAEWLAEPWDESMEEQIVEFRRRAWQFGGEAKRSHSWCSSYESVMTFAGITPMSLTPRHRHSLEEIASMEDGTIIVVSDDNGVAIFRVNAEKAFQTYPVEFLGGSEDARPDQMAQVYKPGERMQVLNNRQMEALPIGTRIKYQSGQEYTRIASGRWSRRPQSNDAGSPSRDFRFTPTEWAEVDYMGAGRWMWGSTLTEEEARELPVGSTFLHASAEGWEFRTRTVDGHLVILGGQSGPDENPDGIVYVGEYDFGRCNLMVTNYHQMDAAEPGSVIAQGSGVQYTKHSNGRWYHQRRGYHSRNFFGGDATTTLTYLAPQQGVTLSRMEQLRTLPDNSVIGTEAGGSRWTRRNGQWVSRNGTYRDDSFFETRIAEGRLQLRSIPEPVIGR